MVETMPPEIPSLHEDIVAALGELPEIVADETANTGTYSYKYASLAGIMKAVRPVLAKHHLAVSQLVTTGDGRVTVGTSLVHRSGQTFQSGQLTMPLPNTPQALGSMISYLRRYQLVALLGLAIEDDDAKGASSSSNAGGSARGTSEQTLSDAQRRRIMSLFGELGMNGAEFRDERLSLTAELINRDIETTNEVTRDEAIGLIDALAERVERLREGSYTP
jgi:hypothetical protein